MRAIPREIAGYGAVRAYVSARAPLDGALLIPEKPLSAAHPSFENDLRSALQIAGLTGGETISFHHHLRNGDNVLCATIDTLHELGLGGFHLAASSIFPVHGPLGAHFERGTIDRVSTAYMAGPVAEAVAAGQLDKPVVLQTHGGRARAIETAELQIDVAIVAASMVDRAGNLTGRYGPEAFGPMGYAMVDAARAKHVIAVTDCVVDRLPCAPDIAGGWVDQVVVLPRIGDAARIVSGTTQITRDPVGLQIATLAADLIAASGAMVPGMTFQTGAGGTSLAVAEKLGQRMQAAGIVGRFASGGITAPLVDLHRAGLFEALWDVQCFDLAGVESLRDDANHRVMSASEYANPLRADAVVDQLDVVILGAAEVDLEFNVNVTTGSDGRILGGSGGHADCAVGAGLTIIVTPLAARGWPRIVDAVRCVTTPGESIDAVVCEAGIAIHPNRAELRERAIAAGLPVMGLADLQRLGPEKKRFAPAAGRIIAVSEYRDGRVLDVLRCP